MLFRSKGVDYEIGGGKMGTVTKLLYDTVTGIQNGVIADEYGWMKRIS